MTRVPRVRQTLAALVLACGLSVLGASTAHASDPGSTLGVYRGANTPGEVAEFERWLDRPVAKVMDFLDGSTWATIENPGWWTAGWSRSEYGARMIWSVPMLPASGGSLAAGASGEYNAHFRVLAERLVAGGQGEAILRPGWEFNGSWFPWTIATPDGAADFAAYWRQLVTSMRGVPGAHFRFDWSPTSGGSWHEGRLVDPEAAWPGDEYVDYIGLDQYDQSWAAGHDDAAARWQSHLTQPYGLEWHRRFAARHGKPMSLPEWGLTLRPDGHGGGDAPSFITRMYEWIARNDVAYHVYFEYDVGDTLYRLMTGRFPHGAETFRRVFGGTARPVPPATLEAPSGAPPTTGAPPGRARVRMTRPRVTRRSVRLSGSAAGTRDERLSLRFERRSRRGWRIVWRRRVSVNADGCFGITVRGLQPAGYRATAAASGGGAQSARVFRIGG